MAKIPRLDQAAEEPSDYSKHAVGYKTEWEKEFSWLYPVIV